MKEAILYSPLEGEKVQCRLCRHECRILPSRRGICGVRENRGGKLFSLVFGRAISMNVDPIEKKPLFHFLPGSTSFSVASAGCNFRCLQCQNHEISQMPVEEKRIDGSDVPPARIVSLSGEYQCRSISYTYTEPTIYFEYAFETAALASQAGIKNVFVTNGYMTEEALRTIQPYLDGANVDLKSFREEFYKKVCGARLGPVLENLILMRELGIWVEVTTLIIPTWNDSDKELEEIAQFIRSLGSEVPWHISAFYPTHKMLDLPRTPPATLHRAREIGLNAGLRYVYCGNIPGQGGEDTRCHQCGRSVIQRVGFRVTRNEMENGECPHCHSRVDGVWA